MVLTAVLGACNLASGNGLDPYAELDSNDTVPASGGGGSSGFGSGGGGTVDPGGGASRDASAAVPDARPSDPGTDDPGEPIHATYQMFGELGSAGQFGPFTCPELGVFVGDEQGRIGFYLDSSQCDTGAPLRYELAVLFAGAVNGQIPDAEVDFGVPDGCLETLISMHVTGPDWSADYGGVASVFTRPECAPDADDAGSGGSSPVTAGLLIVSRLDPQGGNGSLQLNGVNLTRAAVMGNAPSNLATELTNLFVLADVFP